MALKRDFMALERRAVALGFSPNEVAREIGISPLKYWRAKEAKVKRMVSRTKVFNAMREQIERLEQRKAEGMDLFDYPASPGFKDEGTSKDAAKSVTGTAPLLRSRVLAALESAGNYGFTAHECAAKLGETVFAVAPRLTELKMLGKVEKTGKRRPNASGRYAVVWRKA